MRFIRAMPLTPDSPLLELLSLHVPADAKEREDLERMRAFAAELPSPFSRSQPTAHFTGSAVVVDPSGERVVLLHRAQAIWATGLPGDRVLSFSAFEASDLASLRDEMRRRGVTHAVYTWRRPATTDAERFYDRRRKVDLAALFASGGPVEGFEHVATLPAPARLGQPPAQVYRLAPEATAR
jgi:hypothetical protein